MPATTTPVSGADPGAGPDADRAPRGRRQRLALVAGLTAMFSMVGLWLYAFFVYDPGLKVDELADRTFPVAAERVCATAVERLAALPEATEARTAAERADVVDRADAVLGGMVEDLRPLVPEGPERVTAGIEEWLADWEDHIADRAAYAEALRSDPGARFLERAKGSRQLSRAIDGFAEVNRMPSCATPDDVG